MGQNDVLEVLAKGTDWMTSTEIASHLECSASAVRTALTKLHKYDEVAVKTNKFGYYQYRKK